MHTFLSTLILPLPILWLMITIGMTGYLLKKNRLARVCLISAISWLGLITTAGFLGVPPDDIRQFTTTKNTADEAATYRLTFGIQNKLYLVTNAVHMPRAMYLFRREGINVTAAPTNFLIKKGSVSHPFTAFIPRSDNLFRMEKAPHEYIGQLFASL